MKVKADKRPLSSPLSGGSEGATVAVDALEVGRVVAPPQFFERAGGERVGRLRMLGPLTPRSNWWTVPCPAYVVTHPTAGHFLVDTGLHPSVTSKPSANMGRAVARYGRPELEPGEDLPAQLRAKGIDSKTISTVVMTHLHFDHASGMAEFAGASFVLAEREWEAATTGQNPFFHGYRPAQYDYAFDYRTIDFDGPTVGSYASFGRTFDLFGDGSVRLAYTPGPLGGPPVRDLPPPRPRPGDRRRRDLHPGSTGRRAAAATPGGSPHLAPLRPGTPPIPAPVPPGGDRPGPRPEDVAGAQAALRVA